MAAAIAVDGTARVQTVGAAEDPMFRRVLEAFDALTISLTRTGLRLRVAGARLVAKREADLAAALDAIASQPRAAS